MSNNSSKSLGSIDPRTQWKWRLPPVKLVNNRDFYGNLVQGKTVLHIGCTDHKELIDIKMKNHEYLHVKLMEHARIIHGIDINKEAIDYLRTKYNITNIYYCDVTQPKIPNELLVSYDIVLIPEVIEHILNLGNFLKSVRRFMSPKSLLVIGTPNTFKLHSFFTVLKGYEEVNPDHKYYFSYSTLKCLLGGAGFNIDKWYMYIYGNPKRMFFKYGLTSMQGLIKSLLIEINPWFGDGIIVQVKSSQVKSSQVESSRVESSRARW
jgi:SAM-dependent methyltransferase